MKLNPKIYRKAAEIVWVKGRAPNCNDPWLGYCCNALELATEKNDDDSDYLAHVSEFEELFYPTLDELSEYGYWGKASHKTTECRVLALLLLSEMAKDT